MEKSDVVRRSQGGFFSEMLRLIPRGALVDGWEGTRIEGRRRRFKGTAFANQQRSLVRSEGGLSRRVGGRGGGLKTGGW